MEDVIVDIQALLARIRRIEARVTSDHKLIRACHKAAKIVNQSLKPVHPVLN